MADGETVNGSQDDRLVVLAVKVSKREKALIRADAESKGREFLSGHTRQILRHYLMEEFGSEALDG